MNLKTVKTLADLMEKSSLSALEVSEGDLKIRLERAPQGIPAQAPAFFAPAPVAQNPQPVGAVLDFNNITEIKSPLVGVYYGASSPDAEPFVSKGGRVKKGDVLCIIEAMKLMNEIVAETDGEIADICVENGQVVEFGQVLFKLF